jgi:hypothetical protein
MKKETIFDIYSKNLHMLVDEKILVGVNLKYKQTYICPICLIQFDKSSLALNQPIFLTYEDVPPKSLGGKPNILTCNKCNNTCGSQVDVHLQGQLKKVYQSQFPPKSKLPVTINQNGLELKGTISTNDRTSMSFFVSNKNNDPKKIDQFNIALNLDPKNKIVSAKVIEPKKVDLDRIPVALLKINYLLAFEKFGYLFILDNRYDLIRKQILEPNYRMYPYKFWFVQNIPNQYLGTNVIMNRGIKSICSSFILKEGSFSITVSTVLPLPIPYSNIDKLMENILNLSIGDKIILSMRKPSDNYLYDVLPNHVFNITMRSELLSNLNRVGLDRIL